MTKQERSWVLYDWANSAYSLAITTAIFPIFFKNVAAKGLEGFTSTAYLGYGNSIYTLLIAFLAPILGTIADYKNNKKRFFTFFFSIGVLATFSLTMINEGEWIKAITIYIFTAIGFAGANIFYDSFLIDVTENEKMDWISTSGYAWGYIGSTIPFILSMLVILKYKQFGLSSSISAVHIAFIITALWWFVFTIPFFKNVKQIYFIEPPKSQIKESFQRLIATLKEIRQYKHVFLFLVAYFFYIDGVHTIIKMATAFGTDIGIHSNTLMVIVLVIQFVAFPFALLYGKLAKIFSAKKMLYIGISVYIIITTAAFFMPQLGSPKAKITLFWILSMLVASSQGGIQALSRSYYAKLIPKNKSAEFFGFYNIFGKFAAIFGPFLMGLMTQITKSSSYGVCAIVILFIIGIMVLTKVQPSQ